MREVLYWLVYTVPLERILWNIQATPNHCHYLTKFDTSIKGKKSQFLTPDYYPFSGFCSFFLFHSFFFRSVARLLALSLALNPAPELAYTRNVPIYWVLERGFARQR